MLLKHQQYWHGTYWDAALRILCEGFRVPREWRYLRYGQGGVFREGVYLTKNPASAAFFGSIIIRCQLRPGVRILWTDRPGHSKALLAARREFGKDIVSDRFLKMIPSNKRLTKSELIALVTHLANRWRPPKKEISATKNRETGFSTVTPRKVKTDLRTLLRTHKYDAIGERTTYIGVCVFNPSLVAALDMWTVDSQPRGALRPLSPSEFVASVHKVLQFDSERIAYDERSCRDEEEKHARWWTPSDHEQAVREQGSRRTPRILSAQELAELRDELRERRDTLLQDRRLLATFRRRHGIGDATPIRNGSGPSDRRQR